MALGVDYTGQDCSLARALEVVGERWTMLIVRDAFFGVRRFSDFHQRLDISRAVLTQRLAALVEAGVLQRVPRGGREDYELTEAGLALWPSVHALMQWGESRSTARGPRRIFSHAACGEDLDTRGWCAHCRLTPLPTDLETRPGPGSGPRTRRRDAVSVRLRGQHRLLEPVTA